MASLRISLMLSIFIVLHSDRFVCVPQRCPLHQMYLQKIIGYRPIGEYMTPENLIYISAFDYPSLSNYTKDNRYTAKAIEFITNFRNHQTRLDYYATPTTIAICHYVCNEDKDCVAFVHLLDTDECYGLSSNRMVKRQLPFSLVADNEAVFYEKTCLSIPKNCKNRLWVLTKIPGSSLIVQGRKTLSTLVTHRQCAEECLFEMEFNCLSATFTSSRRNNRNRFFENDPSIPTDVLGRCVLHDKDKMMRPDAFRAAPYDQEYIENQCVDRPTESDYCSYELYANVSFAYADVKYIGLTQKECQSFCTNEARFFCQGVSYYHSGSDSTPTECLLHSEDTISMGPRSMKIRENSVYMRRVKCLDVQVSCTKNEMSVKYVPGQGVPFRGKMYVSSHSNGCPVAYGDGRTKTTSMRLSIGNETKEHRCGILRAYDITENYHRTFISTLVVIQNNANVQSQGDRIIKVGCIINNMKTSDFGVDTADDNDRKSEEINDIAVASSIHLTTLEAPPNDSDVDGDDAHGPLRFTSSGSSKKANDLKPEVIMKVIDLSHQQETNDVRIGQSLELQIIAQYATEQQMLQPLPPPNHRATSLIAKANNNSSHVLLIDENGCPVDATVFPALERYRNDSQNILRARFHAFKFAGDSIVKFDVRITFCNKCPEMNCQQLGHHRHKRQMTRDTIKVQNPVYISTAMDIENQTVKDEEKRYDADKESELSLNYNLNVRGPDSAKDSAGTIHEQNGFLLITSDDDRSDNLCLNSSLLIALLIFCLIFFTSIVCCCCLLIIQKYKCLTVNSRKENIEDIDYLEARRVHWVDQTDYM